MRTFNDDLDGHDFEAWLATWIARGADKYTFPDGTMVEFKNQETLLKYFNQFKDRVVPHTEEILRTSSNIEPLVLWFPELNSVQIARLRTMIRETEMEARKDQIVHDFLKYHIELNVDESQLIEIKEQLLKELE